MSVAEERTNGIQGHGRASRATFVPRADVFEDAEHVRILLDMPGVTADSLDVELEKDVLSVEGRVSFEPPEGLRTLRQEYRIGDYQRTFTISDRIDRDAISASARNGVVEIVLPKVEQFKPKKIAVTAA